MDNFYIIRTMNMLWICLHFLWPPSPSYKTLSHKWNVDNSGWPLRSLKESFRKVLYLDPSIHLDDKTPSNSMNSLGLHVWDVNLFYFILFLWRKKEMGNNVLCHVLNPVWVMTWGDRNNASRLNGVWYQIFNMDCMSITFVYITCDIQTHTAA